MKLSKMSLLFVVIIIPILFVFSKFVDNQIKTVNMNTKYDTKIMSATQDAIKALEMNTFGVITKSNTATMRRNIQASVNSFVNSYAANFGVTGYDKSDVLSYVPALLYTMYDGIYIYGPTTDRQDIDNAPEGNYANYVLKPYIYYSARYKNDTAGNEYDVVINYSLDNYINITGTIGSEYISRSGYLIDTESLVTKKVSGKDIVIAVKVSDKSEIDLENELLYENVTLFSEDYNLDGSINQSDIDESPTATMDSRIQKVISGEAELYPITMNLQYIYGNDKQKYYVCKDPMYPRYNGKWFKYNALGKIIEETNPDMIKMLNEKVVNGDSSAKQFYQEAYEFSEFIEDLGVTITPNSMIKPNGDKVSDLADDKVDDPYYIYKGDKTNILNANIDKDYFEQHKLNIMKTIITDNLNVAISSYSNGNVSDFYMPEISETEWEKILTNISMVSFVQGMPMGLKTYNNYVIVTSTNNEMYVGENSIYYVINAGKEYNRDINIFTDHHIVSCKTLNNSTSTEIRGYASTEYDKHTVNYMTEYTLDTGEIRKTDHYLYYYKHHSLDCYNCIVSKISEASSEAENVMKAKIHAMARIKHNQIKTTEILNNR